MAPTALQDVEQVPASEPVKTLAKKKEPTPLELISQGVCLPGIPIFSDIEKERHFILTHMAGAFRVFARKGYTEGMSGHISVRDPENPHTFWTNPLGRHFALLTASDMILVDFDGKPIGGNTSRRKHFLPPMKVLKSANLSKLPMLPVSSSTVPYIRRDQM